MPDCAAIIAGTQAASDTVISACIAHAATIDAARIQVKATAQSSHWTLVAALIAFLSALYAARAPGIRERRDRDRLARAYRYRIYQVISDVIVSVHSIRRGIEKAQEAHEATKQGAEPVKIALQQIVVPDEMSPKEWKDHALLDYDEIEAVIRLHKQIESFATASEGTIVKPDSSPHGFGILDASKVDDFSLRIFDTQLKILEAPAQSALYLFQQNVIDINPGSGWWLVKRNLTAKINEWPEWPERLIRWTKGKSDRLKEWRHGPNA